MKISILSLCATLLILSGCNTYQKQLRKATAFFGANKVELAKLCESSFVPETLKVSKTDTLITTDTVYTKGDSVQCPPAVPGKTVFVKCPPVAAVYKTLRLRDTVTVTDPKRENILNAQVRIVTDSLTTFKEKYRKSEESNGKKMHVIWVLTGFIVLCILGIVLKLTSRI